MSFSDQELIALLPKLRRCAKSVSGNQQYVEDLVQDTVIKALVNRDKFKPGSNLGAWLLIIMRNHFVSSTRRNKFKGETYEGAELDLSVDTDPAYRVDLQKVLGEISHLPERKREELSMVMDGFSYDEIAAELHISLGTVKSSIFRTRALLNKHFGQVPA